MNIEDRKGNILKKGDKIKLIDNSPGYGETKKYKVGKVFTIKSFKCLDKEDPGILTVIEDSNIKAYPHRFLLISLSDICKEEAHENKRGQRTHKVDGGK